MRHRKYLCVLWVFPLYYSIPSLASTCGEIVQTKVCTDYTKFASDGTTWTGTTCWYENEYEDHACYEEGGTDDGGSGSTGGTGADNDSSYLGTPVDNDADGQLDCWKDVVKDGDYHLDSGDDFGHRIIDGQDDHHKGIDIQATLGTQIYSPGYGRVRSTAQSTEESPYNGAHVRMRYTTSDGIEYEAVMIHMKKDSVIVNRGDIVKPGQLIGEVNSTGQSSGNHLHFQIYRIYETEIEKGKVKESKKAVDPVSRMGDEQCTKQGVE
ncbi:hypothetical protein HMF8227_00104 [Saliniradius amylolyticus]|uniref:M23ase beta-sheet core domain-containing protein n=1 Tax=Saliniradius amylolyticus TaxID=2183582 RepID=A0A2S2DZA6_9ALTE|nr:M23 family metallopeptidase [Saliniradius amylolyticus]AWL10612.1 hypothetical protein HMF8227_00104 [Saliniradius amylolyticus]